MNILFSFFGTVVQLVRTLPCHGRGRGFESRPSRQNKRAKFFGYYIFASPTGIEAACVGVGLPPLRVPSVPQMKFFFKKKSLLERLTRDIQIVVGLVLIWRGIWYVLDTIDVLVFGQSHAITSIIGIIAGLAILYFPDKDFKEIEKL